MSAPSPAPKNTTVIILLVATLVAGIMGLSMVWPTTPKNHHTGAPTSMDSGAIALGAEPYALQATDGSTLTPQSYAGQHKLIYFGFACCADVCPAGLSNITNGLYALGDAASRFQPIFITVDPANDSLEKIRDFLKIFDGRFIGATGSAEAIAAAKQSFRVYASSSEPQNPAAPINHSDFIYWMGPDGALINVFPGSTEPKALAAALRQQL